MKRILFLGQKPIGERCFELLLASQGPTYMVAGVCSNTSTNVWWKTNAIYQKAVKLELPFFPNEKRNEQALLDLITSESVNMIISVQHSWILPDTMLKAVNGQALNLHNAKLPDYKGYYTVSHAIINGEKTYTSTIHWMIKEVDQGAIAFEETIPIADDDTTDTLYRKSTEGGGQAFARLVDCLKNNTPIPRHPIQGEGHFYAREDLEKARAIKNPNDPMEIDRKRRAFITS